jgi:predicted TPR repeat methyltransferase
MYDDYFKCRNIEQGFYQGYRLPPYFKNVVPRNKSARILDIGCGFGQMLLALRKEGYRHLTGIDISAEAIDFCLKQDIEAIQTQDLIDFCRASGKKYDLIIMSHVLEHLEKAKIIETLHAIKAHLMQTGAALIIMVPNAQSSTGCYWAYEDFTHTTLFTAGSLYFVLKSAGFESVEFLDPDGLAGSKPVIRHLRRLLLLLYRAKLNFWNFVTISSFHRPSPQIFTFEIKAVAK